MSEMIERVAKALCDCYGRDHKDHVQFHTRAEACIKAMREPTNKMLNIPIELFMVNDAIAAHVNRKHVWATMIDAALKDG